MRVSSPVRTIAVGTLVATACLVAIATNTAAESRDDTVVAAVYAPWRDPTEVFTHAAAAAPVMSQGAAPFILLLRPRSPAERDALNRSGAWLILDGSLARWCGSASGGDDVA